MSRAAIIAIAAIAPALAAAVPDVLHAPSAVLAARLIAATAQPVLVPPVPIAVHWKAQRIGTLDLGAPLVALAAADLDGDGKGELYAVTPAEVVAIALAPRLHELGRVAFVGDPATVASRDVVGTAERAPGGGAILAAVSGFARGLRVRWRQGALVGEPGAAGFPTCPGETAQLSPGKNFFGDGPTAIYAEHCRDGLVDRDGRELRVRAAVTVTGKLNATMLRCDGPPGTRAACHDAGSFELAGAGWAFDLADLDRDGTPELITSGAGAPGDADAVKIVTLGGDDKKPMYRHAFAGGVAGVVAIDLDGDGTLEVIAAVRLAGATRVDLWRLN
jgi:hypothetical protein